MEYYEAISSNKFGYFKKRLKEVFQNKNVIRAMNQATGQDAGWYFNKNVKEEFENLHENI